MSANVHMRKAFCADYAKETVMKMQIAPKAWYVHKDQVEVSRL